MSTRLTMRVFTVVAAGFLAAPGVFGQILNPRVTISGGDSMLKADRTFTTNGQTFNTQYAGGGRGKARLTLDLTKHFSVEALYGFGTSNLKVTDTGNNPQTSSFGVKGHEIQENVLHFFSGSVRHLRSFLLIGVGDALYVPTSADLRDAAIKYYDCPAQL